MPDFIDDPAALTELDSGGLLRATATAGAQVRSALNTVTSAALADVASRGPVRSLVVVGTGGSHNPGALLVALAAAGSQVPVAAVRGPALPAWVGVLDLVVVVSASGSTRETLAAVTEADRRGCSIVGIGAGGSLLEQAVLASRGVYFATSESGRPARVGLWSLVAPLLLVADQLGALHVSQRALYAMADRLDERAVEYGPVNESLGNEAKLLALSLQGCLPVVIGTSALTAAVAHRMVDQLAANAKLPAIADQVAQAISAPVALLDGPLAAPADPFHDPFEDPTETLRLHLVLLRTAGEQRLATVQADALADLAQQRGVSERTIRCPSADPLIICADLVALVDYTSLYVGLLAGRDPWASPAIATIRERVADQI